jgi:hypothetical protein
VDRRVDLFLRDIWLCPVKDPTFIGAGRNTIPTTDAPVIIDYHDPIRFLPSGMNRTYLHTGRVLALLALDREIDEPLLRNGIRVIIMFRVFEIDQVSSLESEDPDPVELRIIARMIVFLHTSINASSTANTSRKLQAVSPEGMGNGFLRADLKFPSIFL